MTLKIPGIDSKYMAFCLAVLLSACGTGADDEAAEQVEGATGGTDSSSGTGAMSGIDTGSGGGDATGGRSGGAASGGTTATGGSAPTGGAEASGGSDSVTGGSDPGTGGATSSAHYPSDILLGLTDWKVTLPVDEDGKDSSGATNVDDRNSDAWEVVGEDLVDYEYPPYFLAKDGEVFFRAHVLGATTSGSKYPRSELRQLVGGGDNYWSVQKKQSLEVEMRVTHLPVNKPEVSLVQIHGPEDEPLRVQYHSDVGVYIIWNESNKDTENAIDYTLGEGLRITVAVEDGEITTNIVNLDTKESTSKTWTSSDSTGYFKVGCYTQSSAFLADFKDGYENEPDGAYGEVAVSRIELLETYP